MPLFTRQPDKLRSLLARQPGEQWSYWGGSRVNSLCLCFKSWYTSAMYILQLLCLKISSCTNLTLSHLVNTVKRKLIKMYTSYWNQERDKHMNSGKLDTYFSLKKLSAWSLIYLWQIFITEELFVRYALVLTILWQNLEGRYKNPKPLPREERICQNCNLNVVENEIHFLIQCTKYKLERAYFYRTIFLSNQTLGYCELCQIRNTIL